MQDQFPDTVSVEFESNALASSIPFSLIDNGFFTKQFGALDKNK